MFFLFVKNFVIGGADISDQKIEEDHRDEHCNKEPHKPCDKKHKGIVFVKLEIKKITSYRL
jgi:hypothetical protein